MSHRLEYGTETHNTFIMRCDDCGAEHSELVHKSSRDLDVHSSILATRMYWFYNWGQQRHMCSACLGKKIARSI